MRLLDTLLKVPEESAETSTPTVQLAPAARAGKLGIIMPLANSEMLDSPALAVKITGSRILPLSQSVDAFGSGATTIPEGRLLLKLKVAVPAGLLVLSRVKVKRLV